MPWFRVDDNLAMHRKALTAGNAALGMWVRAGSWSMANLTNGHIPSGVTTLLGSKTLADKLVTAGLWHKTDDGYLFHEWDQRQPTKEKVIADREAATKRKQSWRQNGGGNA